MPALIAALGQEDLGEGVAAKALAKMGPAAEAAVPALIKGLQAAEPRRRWNAAQALGQIGPKAAAAVPSLERLLKDDSIPVRAESARALGRIGDEARRSVPAIVALLDDSDAHVRAMAARALGWLRTPTPLPALDAARKDRSGRVGARPQGHPRITDSKGRSTETDEGEDARSPE